SSDNERRCNLFENKSLLKQMNALLNQLLSLLLVPYTHLHLADMSFLQHKHAYSPLAYPSANRLRQLVAYKHPMQSQTGPVDAISNLKLPKQRDFVNADAH